MTNKELQAARKLLFLDVKEAAEHIGKVSPRTWQRWEDKTHKVPPDVAQAMEALLSKRRDAIEAIEELSADKEADELAFEYYMTSDEYKADHKGATTLDWRLSQSVAAYFVGEGYARLN